MFHVCKPAEVIALIFSLHLGKLSCLETQLKNFKVFSLTNLFKALAIKCYFKYPAVLFNRSSQFV